MVMRSEISPSSKKEERLPRHSGNPRIITKRSVNGADFRLFGTLSPKSLNPIGFFLTALVTNRMAIIFTLVTDDQNASKDLGLIPN